MAELSDEALLAEAAREASNGPAFRTLVERHRQRVWQLCYRLMDNEHDAQDAAQEVFVRLFLHRAKFEGRSKFTTWLHGIAVRTCLSLRRGRGRRRRREVVVEPEHIESADRPGAPEGARLDLEKMLGELNDEDRALVILKYAEGYTFEELGDMFDLTTSAVKMRVSRACDRLEAKYSTPAGESQEPRQP